MEAAIAFLGAQSCQLELETEREELDVTWESTGGSWTTGMCAALRVRLMELES